MSIAIKILCYIFIVAGIFYFKIKLPFIEQCETPGKLIALFLFLLYVLLVISEVWSRKRKGEEYEKVKKASFMLSFSIVVIWGVLLSFADGPPSDISPLELIGFLVGYFLFGLLFGLMGNGFARLSWDILTRKQKEAGR